jgi:alkyl sulfatase BDS1-like metallo-beta-lactamase superfamily hydrolase
MDAIASENVIALPAWGRRGVYQFGLALPLSETGFVTTGDGPGYPSTKGAPISTAGTLSLLPPTREIEKTGETVTIDGVRIEFQLTPGTEAPAEMNIYFPDLHALCLAENLGGTLHNILPLRGAEVRDAKRWADELTESLRLYGDKTDLVVTSHFWPHWGNQKIVDYISAQRDALKYMHDQTVRLMNNGLDGAEIAERLKFPDALANRWFNRENYGTLSHNVKAIYQRYLGWYDGNPADLNPLPIEDAAPRYVEAMGGPAAVLAKAQTAFDNGDYRWAAELLSKLVFATPEGKPQSPERQLLADTLEQLGYQAESGSWRNAYLMGALELRKGAPGQAIFDASGQTFRNLPLHYVLDLLAVRVVPERALANPMRFNLVITAEDAPERVEIRNGVLIHQKIVGPYEKGTHSLKVDRASFIDAVLTKGSTTTLSAEDAELLGKFSSLFDPPKTGFALVTAQRVGRNR